MNFPLSEASPPSPPPPVSGADGTANSLTDTGRISVIKGPDEVSGRPELYLILVGEKPYLPELKRLFDTILVGFKVAIVPTVPACLELLNELEQRGNVVVPLIFLCDELGSVDMAVKAVVYHRLGLPTRFILLTAKEEHDDVARVIDAGRLATVVAEPVTPKAILEQTEGHMARWLRRNYPMEKWAHDLIEQNSAHVKLPEADLFSRLEMSSEDLISALLEGIEKAMGRRPRLLLPPGVCLTREGKPIDAVYLILEGSVALHRSGEKQDILLHHASSGPLIGMVSRARRQRASVTSKTTTPVKAVRISDEQLDHVLTQSPEVSALLAILAVQALTDRLIRAEVLHVEKEELSMDLEAERSQLARTLEELEQARADLVDAARFALLGELAAGFAHELNNPVAAILRAAQFIAEDVQKLLKTHDEQVRQSYQRSLSAPVTSTAAQRAAVRELLPAVGDRNLARRLVEAGVTDASHAKQLIKHPELLENVELASAIGTSVHNIEVAARRMTGLVESLRSYARPTKAPEDGVDLVAGIEDCLRLTANRMDNVKIRRDYAPEVPPLRAYPSQLEQIWTNLLVNAAEAMEGQTGAEITVRVAVPDAGWVRVQVIDNGPGIPAELQEKVFKPHFTTKSGTVRYGLGMGLGITSQIVETHGGFISVDSRPGYTCMQVDLPVTGPDAIKEGE